jgi:hypothetical protein
VGSIPGMTGSFFATRIFGPERADLLAAQLPATTADSGAERDTTIAAIDARVSRIDTAQNTQIYEGTNQIQRMVMARQLLKGLLSPTDLRLLRPSGLGNGPSGAKLGGPFSRPIYPIDPGYFPSFPDPVLNRC